MRKLFLLLLAFHSITASAQKKDTSFILSKTQIESAFPQEQRTRLGITFPIYRVYRYTDQSGQYYLTLTESRDLIGNDDTISYKIRAFIHKIEKDSLRQMLTLNDQIRKEEPSEGAIWFMTRWCLVQDIDKDGLTDIILPYCTVAMNGVDDGRIKIFVINKGKKIAIRHQNGVLDDERETVIDKAYYDLPASIRTTVTQFMESMVEKNKAIFPYKWQAAMKNKKTVINERH
ncbi:hypothetical protein HHL16_10230 [Pseudoflavitalea sp. G-6-1-2]|uniref:M949_RS01915 family surface polysaccharide biosynthesis protein n=1 Tax=Pseudoflavitalea sp. G-6-1-2 TaxID=2728841 RepID=UPI00146C41FA|nr:hypothetical protein [Pseudoflavitalea sp. G-6-1-2]NML21251.1 hypothetical protein [Pseudoflavitalea sp. G-6-1-2]